MRLGAREGAGMSERRGNGGTPREMVGSSKKWEMMAAKGP